jgi:flagellar hook-associated protein FlgK
MWTRLRLRDTISSMSTTSIALSGVNAAMLQMDVAAHNIANQQTPDFKPQAVVQSAEPEGGVRTKIVQTRDADSPLEGDIAKQMSASYGYQANLRVLQTEEKMMGALLDARV